MTKVSTKETNVSELKGENTMTNSKEQNVGTTKGEQKMEKDYSNLNYVTTCIDNGYDAKTGEAQFTTKWLESFVYNDKKYADILDGLESLCRFEVIDNYKIERNSFIGEDGKMKRTYTITTIGLDVQNAYKTKSGMRKRFQKASAIAEAVAQLNK